MTEQQREGYIEELLRQLTLEEKIGMIHGDSLFATKAVERLGIPELVMSDGPMGVRFEHEPREWRPVGLSDDYVTYMPCNSAIASTWNRRLAGKAGSVLGEEARGRGKDVILAPGINIKRSPLCGRNFEYMSEDPRLIEELVVPMVQGIQSHDVAACVKHFAANSQETERLWVDTVVDDKTLHEIYFPGFKAAVDGGLYSIMGAYNRLNGESCCTSEKLLNDVLRDQWGFDGVVISDWGGVHDTVLAAKSGLDVEMDVRYEFHKHYLAEPLKELLAGESGEEQEVTEEMVDRKVANILRMMLRLKMIGPEAGDRSAGAYNTAEHHLAVKEVAEEAVILLKNEEQILPLDPKQCKSVAVIGANANRTHANGGGSAEIKALYEITPLMGIKMQLGGSSKVTYVPGYFAPLKGGRPEISWQAESTKSAAELKEEQVNPVGNLPDTNSLSEKESVCKNGAALSEERKKEIQDQYLQEAVEVASTHDVVIFVGGLNHDYDVEGLDRENMKLPYEQDQVLQAVLQANPNTVVVMYAGSPVEMPWLSGAKALVWSYYGGMEGGTAIGEVLFGKINPSGKLAETFPLNDSQCSAKKGINFGKTDAVEYNEGCKVGYRYYNLEKNEINFCFGHGMCYTTYGYSDMVVEDDGKTVTIDVTVTNTGERTGKEVVQVYVRRDSGLQELKTFEKVELQPGEAKRIHFSLTEKDFSQYHTDKKDFALVRGSYVIEVGSSSRDIRVVREIVK